MEIALAVALGLLFACAFAGIIAMTALGPAGASTHGAHSLARRDPVPPQERPAAPAPPERRDRAA